MSVQYNRKRWVNSSSSFFWAAVARKLSSLRAAGAFRSLFAMASAPPEIEKTAELVGRQRLQKIPPELSLQKKGPLEEPQWRQSLKWGW